MHKNYLLIIISFLLLNLFIWACWSEFVFGIPPIVKYVLSVSALGIILCYRFSSPSKPDLGALYYPFLIVFIIWSVILLISVILNPYSPLWPELSFIQRVFGQPFFFIPYLIPLFVLYSKFDLNFFSQLLHFSLILIFPALIIQLFTIATGISIGDKEQQTRVMIFDLCSGFLLLTAHILRKKYAFTIVFVYTLIMILLFAQWGRRAILMDYIMVVFAMIFLRLRSLFLTFNDRMVMYFAGLLFVLMIISFGHLATSTYVFERGFTQEAFEESRGDVFEGFFMDFYTASDWVFGRGIGGTILRAADSGNADFIESGFLILLFKGGLLYLIPTIIILLRASYLGLTRSNNDLVKALASLILIYLVSMYALNWPEFSTKYVFLWICASACLNSQLRNATNEEVYLKINFRDIM